MPERRRKGPPPPPGPFGPRRAALEARRRTSRRRSRILGVGVAAAVALVVTIVAVVTSGGGGPGPDAPASISTPEGKDRLTTTLLFGTRETSDARADLIWLAVLSYDAQDDRGSLVYVPAHTAVEVPGRGLQDLAEAQSSGGIPLLLVSTENLLGIEIDRYLEMSDRDALVLFEQTGPVSVDVPSEVRVPAGANRARLLFTEGPQELSPEFTVKYLYTLGLDEDDVELGSRHLAFWDGLFKEFDGDPPALGKAFNRAAGALAESDVEAPGHGAFFLALAGLGTDARALAILPVTQISAGGNQLYQTEPEEIETFVAATVGRDAPVREEIEVQVLNGNGVPGIGQRVAERLVGEGFRVILSGNASRLDYENTLIITYETSDDAFAAAKRARDLMGVGRVQVSAQPQGIVDLTIVVGEDFLDVR